MLLLLERVVGQVGGGGHELVHDGGLLVDRRHGRLRQTQREREGEGQPSCGMAASVCYERRLSSID